MNDRGNKSRSADTDEHKPTIPDDVSKAVEKSKDAKHAEVLNRVAKELTSMIDEFALEFSKLRLEYADLIERRGRGGVITRDECREACRAFADMVHCAADVSHSANSFLTSLALFTTYNGR